jgi:hypothetical protein
VQVDSATQRCHALSFTFGLWNLQSVHLREQAPPYSTASSKSLKMGKLRDWQVTCLESHSEEDT